MRSAIYTEFDTAMRSFWSTLQSTHPKLEDVFNSFGASRRVPRDDVDYTPSVHFAHTRALSCEGDGRREFRIVQRLAGVS